MAKGRAVLTILALAVVGALLGALAGTLTVGAGIIATGLRTGFKWGVNGLLFALGAMLGGAFGALFAPAVAFTPWRYVPIGRLFAHLTLGTIIGGCGVALIFPNPIVALIAGMIGFLIAGNRVARRSARQESDRQGGSSVASE